jgi:hypothetical protein
MTRAASWYDDEHAFEREVQRVLALPRSVPEVPGYAELREIARGGQGIVSSAVQLSTRRVVALKVLRLSLEDGLQGFQRFEREIALAASLRHPNLVALYDSGKLADGRPYLVMELVDGPTLEHAPAVLAAREHLLARPWIDELLAHFVEICDGVDYAHRRGILHRDLEPSDVRHDEAIAIGEQVVAKAEAAFGTEHFQTATFRGNLGGYHLRKQDHATAEPLLRESVRVLEATLGEGAANTVGMRGRLIELLRKTGREAEAEQLAAARSPEEG